MLTLQAILEAIAQRRSSLPLPHNFVIHQKKPVERVNHFLPGVIEIIELHDSSLPRTSEVDLRRREKMALESDVITNHSLERMNRRKKGRRRSCIADQELDSCVLLRHAFLEEIFEAGIALQVANLHVCTGDVALLDLHEWIISSRKLAGNSFLSADAARRKTCDCRKEDAELAE